MNKFSFKYYPARILLALVCILLTLIVLAKGIIYTKPNFISLLLSLAGSSSILAVILIYINKHPKRNWFFKVLNLPNLNGVYEGELTSSYHLDDDETKPHIKKFVRLQIYQNLNGFLVVGQFFNLKSDENFTSQTESINHDIVSKGNGNYTISYLYGNKGNKLHKEHKKTTLNNHEGFAVLTYNPKDKTLIGSYFNDGQERPSYGKLNLKKQ